jgi:Bardet-Biedl syndrome 2 protein
VRELLARKQALILELKHYENNSKYNENAMNQMESYESDGVIPANTRLQIGIATSEEKSKNVSTF